MATRRKAFPHAPQLYRAEDVAKILSVSYRHVIRLRDSGQLKGLWIGPRTWRVNRPVLLRFIRQRPVLKLWVNPTTTNAEIARAALAAKRRMQHCHDKTNKAA